MTELFSGMDLWEAWDRSGGLAVEDVAATAKLKISQVSPPARN
ncbi:MAG: hypothetical protein U0941_09275 [Planctomycetaceae bacterium]